MADEELTNDDFDLAFEAAAAGTTGAEGAGDEPAKVEGDAVPHTNTEGAGDEPAKVEGDAVPHTNTEGTGDEPAKVEGDTVTPTGTELAGAEPKPKRGRPKKEPVVEVVTDPAAEAVVAKAAADAEAAAVARELPTEDERALIEQVAKDFPETAKAFEIIQRTTLAKAENMFSKRLADLTQQFNQQLSPALAVTQQVARSQHEATILAVHPTAFTDLPKVEEWIETQPMFLKDTYNRVLDAGTAAEIIDLLNIHKAAVGVVATPTATAENKEEKEEKEKKLNAQEGVRGRRTSERTAVDPNDFDGAFDKFAAKA